MKIVRALWGRRLEFHYSKEIPSKPMFDEVVYVWGRVNYEYLTKLGYNCRYQNDSLEQTFVYKLQALDLAHREFGEILFLDWDIKTPLLLDEILQLKFPNPCMPLYSYPKNYTFPGMEEKVKEDIVKYSWNLRDTDVIPNACLIYFRDFNLGKELIDIHNKYNFSTLIEEFAFYVWTNSTLDEYIDKHDCPHMYGRESDQTFPKWTIVDGKPVNIKQKIIEKLNNYIGPKESKFIHY